MAMCNRVYEWSAPPCARNVEAVDNSAQQLKPKMPLLEEVLNHVNEVSIEGNCNVISRQIGAEFAYNYISRHFGH